MFFFCFFFMVKYLILDVVPPDFTITIMYCTTSTEMDYMGLQ